eukprot:TRINITY_DN4948_c0_g1_i1.p2 TRINITY_DN4948_c0_g1~~TRINITY_DN4948_c0_g1_i1.p2  ORF type:complete len:156 (+),score=30.41 TRINITY_DN4948_c0_g1_i1:32-499(+)
MAEVKVRSKAQSRRNQQALVQWIKDSLRDLAFRRGFAATSTAEELSAFLFQAATQAGLGEAAAVLQNPTKRLWVIDEGIIDCSDNAIGKLWNRLRLEAQAAKRKREEEPTEAEVPAKIQAETERPAPASERQHARNVKARLRRKANKQRRLESNA